MDYSPLLSSILLPTSSLKIQDFNGFSSYSSIYTNDISLNWTLAQIRSSYQKYHG